MLETQVFRCILARILHIPAVSTIVANVAIIDIQNLKFAGLRFTGRLFCQHRCR